MSFEPVAALAAELGLPPRGVEAVLRLFDEGNTVPFVARYRKEATGGLDDEQIRAIQERHAYLIGLEDRRRAILDSVGEQGHLTDELRRRILAATTKAELEDLYLPYRPRRRTRATIARERGLEPLAARIRTQPDAGDPVAEAAAFVDPAAEVPDAAAALAGARDIVAEEVAEDPDVRAHARRIYAETGRLTSKAVKKKTQEPTRFENYYAHDEPVATVPSHRFLAIRRGEREGVLKVSVAVDTDRLAADAKALAGQRDGSPFAAELSGAVDDAIARLLGPSVAKDVLAAGKDAADAEAVEVFARNLRQVLLAAPLGHEAVLGIDPGQRTGCKTVVVDATGRFVTTTVLHLFKGGAALERAAAELRALVETHRPRAIAIGNGTGGRETEAFVRRTLAEAGLGDVVVVSVNEAGASVYSASKVARDEFPDLDVTVRGAISIARRLQDPLAELVKIDPKSIGVGQYQHDVAQNLLARKLDEVIESCVNAVGVDLNTASGPLLSRVAGLGAKVARSIVEHRERTGLFRTRRDVLAVAGLGPKTFEQAAGFLRVAGGDDPLDRSAVHPERRELVARMAADLGVDLARLVGDEALADRVEIDRYVGDDVGRPTLEDIVAELRKPGRDPRQAFEPPAFRDDVQSIEDLEVGMRLEGVVTNVTNFGAFVDVGVHTDGLVHVSQLADRYVADPYQVVKTGDRIQVRVLSVDLPRRRIGLSARSGDAPRPARSGGGKKRKRNESRETPPRREFNNNPFSKGRD